MKRVVQKLVAIVAMTFSFSSHAIQVTSDVVCEIDCVKYPAVGFGTFPLKGNICFKALKSAYLNGYRIIDTATFYGNFDPIGKVLKKYGRDKFYLISKVWPNSHTKERLREDLRKTLADLKTDYLDAYFLHWPNSKVSIEETLSTLEEFRLNKLIRHIGLSNVNINHLKRALELKIPITWIQIEMHPLYYDPELLEFCKNNGIAVQAWGPLARGYASNDKELLKIAQKYEKTPSQIALKWIVQHGCIPLPGSKREKHIQENISIADFMLTEEDMNEINLRAHSGKRERVTPDLNAGFTDEFDFTYDQCWPKI